MLIVYSELGELTHVSQLAITGVPFLHSSQFVSFAAVPFSP